MNIDNAPRHMQKAWLERQLASVAKDARKFGFDVWVKVTANPERESIILIDVGPKSVEN